MERFCVIRTADNPEPKTWYALSNALEHAAANAYRSGNASLSDTSTRRCCIGRCSISWARRTGSNREKTMKCLSRRRMPLKEDQTMSATPVILQGTVRPDGTLELDGKVPLPAGRVSVTLEQVPHSQETDPFFARLREIRAARERAGPPMRTGEDAQAALRQLRDDAAEEVAEVGRLQEQCRRQREEAEKAKEAK